MATLHINKSKVKNSASLHRLSSLFHVNFFVVVVAFKAGRRSVSFCNKLTTINFNKRKIDFDSTCSKWF